MSWDYIQICALYSEIYVILFYIKFLFDCKLQSTQQTDLSCSTRCSLTHFQPSGSMQTLCYCPAAECTQPTDIPHGHACQKSHPGWAGDTTCARATCQAQHGAWKGLWDGTNASCPTAHLPLGLEGLPGTATGLFKGNESKNPLAFCHHDKAGQSEERSHCSTHCPRPQSGGRTSHLCVQRQRHLQVHGQSPAGPHGTPAIAALSHQFQLQWQLDIQLQFSTERDTLDGCQPGRRSGRIHEEHTAQLGKSSLRTLSGFYQGTEIGW